MPAIFTIRFRRLELFADIAALGAAVSLISFTFLRLPSFIEQIVYLTILTGPGLWAYLRLTPAVRRLTNS